MTLNLTNAVPNLDPDPSPDPDRDRESELNPDPYVLSLCYPYVILMCYPYVILTCLSLPPIHQFINIQPLTHRKLQHPP